MEYLRVMLQRNKADLFLHVAWAIDLDPLPRSTAPIEALIQQLSNIPSTCVLTLSLMTGM